MFSAGQIEASATSTTLLPTDSPPGIASLFGWYRQVKQIYPLPQQFSSISDNTKSLLNRLADHAIGTCNIMQASQITHPTGHNFNQFDAYAYSQHTGGARHPVPEEQRDTKYTGYWHDYVTKCHNPSGQAHSALQSYSVNSSICDRNVPQVLTDLTQQVEVAERYLAAQEVRACFAAHDAWFQNELTQLSADPGYPHRWQQLVAEPRVEIGFDRDKETRVLTTDDYHIQLVDKATGRFSVLLKDNTPLDPDAAAAALATVARQLQPASSAPAAAP